ncbi:MAG: Phosphatidylserine decarboxylase proenzyme [Mycobacterium sp.]|jgi:phosphatidylserine decarboxylase|nr:Phosphatidylserine decarboxylase proenzyme [Mycobacterium sp.]MCW2551907.1 Phosphatidylserine decarboxylase proenzyme [Mycobacterium sp.]MCW2730406.1 Phosphatidylserine decarboxylase proenzyme [Mycobacterium sp.]MDT5312171.1 phosphatidylserine decarboxylase [Mycobacterium sp.]
MARPARPADAADQSEVSRFVELVRSTVPPVHAAGLPFIAGGLGLAAAGRKHNWLRNTGLSVAGACALFFRHPPRVSPTRPGVVVAPADGLVTLIERVRPPAELNMPDVSMTRISIFLSIFDAHVQRAPVAGEVITVKYRPGQFRSADKDSASEVNECNSVWFRTAEGVDVAAVQIAGLIARRIVCTAHIGDKVTLGETYGLIRFGSRLDTYVPADSRVLVEIGQRAIAGETVLAELA